MARKTSIAKCIKVQRLQDKNRMVGQTFNPSGITSKQMDDRENDWIYMMSNKSQLELRAYLDNINEMKADWQGSYSWEWCAFIRRHFIDNSGNILLKL